MIKYRCFYTVKRIIFCADRRPVLVSITLIQFEKVRINFPTKTIKYKTEIMFLSTERNRYWQKYMFLMYF